MKSNTVPSRGLLSRDRFNLLHTIAAAALLLGGLGTLTSRAGVTFEFNYTDVGVGFNDPIYGADRQAALADAAGRVAAYFVNYNATIDIDVNGSITSDNVLASASSKFNAPWSGNGFNDRGDVMLKILGGNSADPNPTKADGKVNWNFGWNWALGNTIGPGQFDFISTAMHELTHATGFAAGISEDGRSGWGDPVGEASSWTPMASWLADSSGNFIISNSFILNKTRWDAAKAGGSSLFFAGPNADAAYGGLVPLYSPTTWEQGSSGGSHMDDPSFVAPNNMLMNAMSQPEGTMDSRAYSQVEIGILKDIGYTQIVPEPSTWAMLVGGLGALLAFRRRR